MKRMKDMKADLDMEDVESMEESTQEPMAQ